MIGKNWQFAMEKQDSPAYTILLDIFNPRDLINSSSPTASEYISALQEKDLVHLPEDLTLDSWCKQVYEQENIFTEVPRTTVKTKSPQQNTGSVETKLCNLHLTSDNQFLDYRFSRVEVVAFDMKKDELISENEPLRAKLLGYGVIRLYKDHEDQTAAETTIKGDDTTMAALGVPFYFTASDLLLGFFDKSVSKHVSYMRLVKTETPNRCIVLLKFRSPEWANEFHQDYNGRPFNSMEPETCQVVSVKEVILRPRSPTDKMNTIPYLLDDPFTKTPGSKVRDSPYVELATCPVCLERLDHTVTGLLTIPCQHTFHYDCLSKWDDDTCPVCRYSSKFDLRQRHEEDGDARCDECGATDNLWICLICGHMGCGRYDLGHAIKHYEDTQHCFAMETSTQRVWDYSGDNYVHRLVQNEADGKLVELPSKDDVYDDDMAKIEKVGLEYSKMLISQLESQREYYDLKFEESQNQLQLANDNLTEMKQSVAILKSELERAKKQAEESNDERRSAKKLRKLQKQYEAKSKECEEESVMNEGLSKKVGYLTEEVDSLKKSNQDLSEQVTDLMAYMEARDKFDSASDDVKEGQVVLVPKRKRNGRGN